MGQLLTPERFETTLKYWNLFEQGLICTLLLSALTVIFGFIIAMILALMRLSNFRPFAFLERLPVQGDRLHATFRVIAKFNPLRFIAAVCMLSSCVPRLCWYSCSSSTMWCSAT